MLVIIHMGSKFIRAIRIFVSDCNDNSIDRIDVIRMFAIQLYSRKTSYRNSLLRQFVSCSRSNCILAKRIIESHSYDTSFQMLYFILSIRIIESPCHDNSFKVLYTKVIVQLLICRRLTPRMEYHFCEC